MSARSAESTSDEFNGAGNAPHENNAQESAAPPALHLAGFWLRVPAFIIDGVILGIISAIASFFISAMTVNGARRYGWTPDEQYIVAQGIKVIIIIVNWLYFALAESSEKQATPGKLAMLLKVTDLEGNRISFRQATRRFFAKGMAGWITLAFWIADMVLPDMGPYFILVGAGLASVVLIVAYAMAGITPQKQALHDMMARCLVIRSRRGAYELEDNAASEMFEQ